MIVVTILYLNWQSSICKCSHGVLVKPPNFGMQNTAINLKNAVIIQQAYDYYIKK